MSIAIRILVLMSLFCILLIPISGFLQSYPIKVEKTISFDSLSIALTYLLLAIGKEKLTLNDSIRHQFTSNPGSECISLFPHRMDGIGR